MIYCHISSQASTTILLEFELADPSFEVPLRVLPGHPQVVVLPLPLVPRLPGLRPRLGLGLGFRLPGQLLGRSVPGGADQQGLVHLSIRTLLEL